jgi:O-antigen/teichoic acid export membrane protein
MKLNKDFLLHSDKVRKSISLFTAMVLSLFTGIVISVINTRFLGKEQYGDFKFLIDIFNFFMTFLSFGFFYTGGRMLAKAKEVEKRKKIFGEIITLAFLIGLLLQLVVFAFSFFEGKLFDHDLRAEIWICLPILFGIPFQLSLEQLLQGDNRIYSLSFMRLAPKIFYIILIIIFFYLTKFGLKLALITHLFSMLSVTLIIIIKYKPKLTLKFKYSKQLLKENKGYGFPVYLGAISGVASNYVAGFSISYFIDNTNVGFYSLAITACMPLAMFPASFGITFFKDFITMKRIPKRVIIATILSGLVLLTGFLVFIHPIVILLYSKEFAPVIKLTYFISIGSLMHGFGDFYNRFLSAKGLGKQLRNINFILGAINIVGYISFVYFFNTLGAALIKLVSGLSYFTIILFHYRKYLNNTIKHDS